MSSLQTPYTLCPISPTSVDRFTVDANVPTTRDIFVVPGTLEKGATIGGDHVIHPEGSRIYYQANLVSCQPINDIHVALYHRILRSASESFSEACVTIFIELRGNLRADYYIVLHESKTISWIDHQCPESFAGATPTKHEHEYWIHMENFPGPCFSTPADCQKLKNVLAGAAVDVSTSEGSTSPMSAEQIKMNLVMLDSFSSEVDINQTYAVARLWNMLLQSQLINKFGTPEARLDRFVTLSERPAKFTDAYGKVAKFMFNTPSAHLVRNSRAWADRIAYTEEWRKFKGRNEQEWKQVMHLACVLVIASLILNSQSTCKFRIITNLALLAGLASIASVYYLLNESQNLGDHATDASVYFQEREEYKYGVQRISIINAMPQALLIWGFIFFVAAILI